MGETRQIRNSLGVLNIYFKALWMPILFFILPLGLAILITWTALSNKEWGFLAFAIFMWLGTGLLLYSFWDYIVDVWRDAFGGKTAMGGRVSRKWVIEHSSHGSTTKEYQIALNDHSFEVSKKIYNWLSEGNEVVVHYWPRSETVAKVEKL